MSDEDQHVVREEWSRNLYSVRKGSSADDQARELFKERVLRARAMSPDDKLGLGATLFTESCERMCDGIRHQHPEADESEVQAILKRQLDRIQKLEEAGIYKLDSE